MWELGPSSCREIMRLKIYHDFLSTQWCALLACDCQFGGCNQAEQERENSSCRDMIGWKN